ncbi:YigZ family protein [Anaerotruncus rubiinfantis]|uniref:YigZ family protein n=1 Tax=Anaerotruncus rubiinfantis TaxID=1720200 RepID=UPI0034A1C8E7
MDEYTTIRSYAEDEFVERRSRFIGAVKPVTTEGEALAFINEKRGKHWDASHNVYAYILRDGQLKRYSDDGEPQGTAGIPVLDVLQKEGLTDLVVVVTRYFGGILLGAGGLVRAYTHGAKLAVDAAERMRMCECTELELEFSYDLYGKISYLLPQHGAVMTTSDFGVAVRLQVLLRDCDLAGFEKALTELTAAQVAPRVIDRRWACMNG